MDIFSPYIIAGAIAWLVAQALKYLILSVRGKKLNMFRQLYLSGSMPSAHSATVVAVLVTVWASEGVSSAIFGVTLLLALIVMYDAVMVRRSSGEQGQALTALIKEQKSKVSLPRVAKGHTPLEVLGGVVVGIITGLIVVAIML